MRIYTMTVDGHSVTSSDTFPVLNPADESVVAEAPKGTVELLDTAVAAARRAFPGWAAQTPEYRSAKLNEIADLIEANAQELSTLLTLEQGKTQGEFGADYEVGGAAAWTRVTAGLRLDDEVIQNDAQGRIVAVRKPLGVVASITPWNWPLAIAIWHVMPAIHIGCTVVIKPSPYTPLTTLRLVELMNTLLPPGVINVVTGGAEIGDRISTHPDINKIVFTGSTAIGRHIMSNSAGTLKRLTLELGGNDAGIILPGTNIDPFIDRLFLASFLNCGQNCSALKRLFVHSSQYEEIVEKIAAYVSTKRVGNGLDASNHIGPLSNRMQLEKVASLVEDARKRGARIVTGGMPLKGPGYFYKPTVVADVSDDMLLVKEEQFGPALPILKYETVEEAVARANSLDVGLGGSVWSNDVEAGAKIAALLECGTAWVNSHSLLSPMAPFGGVKSSGIGTEFSIDGLKEYTYIQVINIAK